MERTTDMGLVNGNRFDRVRAHSAAPVNKRLDEETEVRVARLRHSSPREIGRRMAELDHEWDIDRALMLLFSGLGAFTFAMGNKRAGMMKRWNGWLSLFSTQLAFLGLHA